MTESDAADRTVREFCAAWANKDPDELVLFFTDDGLWRDMPGPCVIGHAPLRAAFAAAIGKSEGDQVRLTQSALLRLISRLADNGLVERGICTEDGRAAWAVLTPTGSARYAEAKPTQRAILRDHAAGLDVHV